jgi:hypothetical protein
MKECGSRIKRKASAQKNIWIETLLQNNMKVIGKMENIKEREPIFFKMETVLLDITMRERCKEMANSLTKMELYILENLWKDNKVDKASSSKMMVHIILESSNKGNIMEMGS